MYRQLQLFLYFLLGFIFMFALGLSQARAAGTLNNPSAGYMLNCNNQSFYSETTQVAQAWNCIKQSYLSSYPNLAYTSTSVSGDQFRFNTVNGPYAGWQVPMTRALGCPTGYTLSGGLCVPPAGTCPANASGSPCTCNSGYQPNQAGLACYPSKYCRNMAYPDGTAGTECFDTAQAACLAPTLSQTQIYVGNGVCKVVTHNPDGTDTTMYTQMFNTAVCPAGDSACLTDQQAKFDAAKSAVSAAGTAADAAKAASSVAAASTAAGDAAAAAATAAGLDASGVAAARTQAQIDAAANTAADQQKISECEKNPDRLGCMTAGEVEAPTLTTQERGISAITPLTVGGTSTCPPDIQLSVLGNPVVMSWAIPCQGAAWLRPIILAMAWLSAGVIFIGGVRGS